MLFSSSFRIRQSVSSSRSGVERGKSIASSEDRFIKLFEDLFSETIKVFPNFIVKQLKEFRNLHRASRHEVFENYKYIMPDPAHCKNNRWNDDGVAFLYLAYDNENKRYQNIWQVQKTCFEELRAKKGEKLSVCKFKAVHRKIKILDLSIDDVDYEKELESLNNLEITYKNIIMKAIKGKPKLMKRMTEFARYGNDNAFMNELEKIQKKRE